MGAISHDLCYRYRDLAREYLAVSVDTGQIVSTNEFITMQSRNKLATPLNTSFKFREEEIKDMLEGLEKSNILIITGRAGVGKSRVALEVCDQYTATYPNYKTLCLFNKGTGIYEDLQVHLSEPGSYLLFVDDANRINRFEYILQFLNEENDKRHFKIIATVRDYATDKILEDASRYDTVPKIELQPFNDNQISELVKDVCGITNDLYLERIADIAKGNPRLAFRAGKIAREQNTLSSIYDVSALYDEYYKDIRRDVEELKDNNLLKIAGIVSFFRTVDRSNEDLIKAIEDVFSISPEIFWEAAKRLNELEILDMHENEIVKMSDQVLSTYFFYLVFFKEKTLDLKILLNNYFPSLKSRIVEAIYPILRAFDSEKIMRKILSPVSSLWVSYEKTNQHDELLQLIHTFWFLKKTDTLQYVKEQIDATTPETIDISSLKYEPDTNIPSPSLLSILNLFKHSDENNFKMALELLYDYLEKRPSSLPKVLHILKDEFGFTHKSHNEKYFIQKGVIDSLWERTLNGENKLFAKVFINVAGSFLNTHYDATESKGNKAIVFIKFDLRSTPELIAIRRSIWEGAFILLKLPFLRGQLLQFLIDYKSGGHAKASDKIIEEDSIKVLHFIESELTPMDYSNCRFVHSYLEFLDKLKIKYERELRDKFSSDTFKLSEILQLDWAKKTELNLGYEEFQQYRRKLIGEYFKSYNFDDYKRLFQFTIEINNSISPDRNDYTFKEGIHSVLLELAEKDPKLYIEVIKHYFETGAPLALNAYLLIDRLIDACGATEVAKILEKNNFPSIREWKFAFFHNLPEKDIDIADLDSLYTLYKEANLEEMPPSMDWLLKYQKLDNDIFINITKNILENAERNPHYAHPFSMLINPHAQAHKELASLFKNDVEILKRAYFAYAEIEQHSDYDGRTFNIILDLDRKFIYEYIDWIYRKNQWPSEYDDNRRYSFIWEREDYKKIITEIIEYINRKDNKCGGGSNSYIFVYFIDHFHDKNFESVSDKQDKLITSLIINRNKDNEFMQFVFTIICKFTRERIISLLNIFLAHNKNFEEFKYLSLESGIESWSGSAIPMLKDKVEYYEAILPLLNTVDFLLHRQRIEGIIRGIHERIEEEKKRDFLEE